MANTDTKLGIVAILPVGAWVSASTYEYLNLVTYGGGAYLALQDVPSGTALSNTTYWLQITEKGLKGDTGAKGDKGDTGDTGNGIASVSVTETSVEGAEHNYTMTVTMTDGTVTTYDYTVTDGAVTSVNGRTGAVIGLAEQDGYYELMSVGSADQLISTQYIEDSVSYKFRTSGGSADIGDREIDEIVGGTINWNQLVQNGNFVDTSGWSMTSSAGWAINNNVATITGNGGAVFFARAITAPAEGHVFLYKASYKASESLTFKASFGASEEFSSFNIGTSWSDIAVVRKKTTASTNLNVVRAYNEQVMPSGATLDVKNVMLIDLTALFGSPTIADHIYNLEQSTAGAGVAWFRKLFPNDYYAYSEPTLTHVSGLTSHDMVGFNAWDEEWELGSYNETTGEKIAGTITIRTKNRIPVLPNTSYYFKSPWRGRLFRYDSNGNYLGVSTLTMNDVFTTSKDTHFITFRSGSGVTTYNHNICINLSWSGTRNGEYEPYVKHSYPLDSSLTLRGIPKLDADGNLYFDGDTYASDGTVTRKYGIVDLGSLTWTYDSSGTNAIFYTESIKSLINTTLNVVKTMCSKYISVLPSSLSGYKTDIENGCVGVTASGIKGRVCIRDDAYADATAFKTAMNGVMLVYELATPTAESATPYTNPQIVNDWGTEEYISETIVPVGHNTKYTANLRDKLQHLPDLADSDGYYMIQQTGTNMSLVPYADVKELPDFPTTDGAYILKATVSGGTTSLSWEVQA